MIEPDQSKPLKPSDEFVAMPSTRQCSTCGFEWDSSVATCPQDGTILVSPIETDPVFNKYEFLGVIGIGGMGVIYKARQTILDKVVAIKMLHPRLLSGDAIRRFQIEGKAASMLEHPQIIKVHDLGVCGSGPYMILDYVKGRTLAQVLQSEGPLTAERFLRMFIQVCDALEHAHNRGVFHRDLKPSNIMVTRNFHNEEEIRIMDFGIAKLIDDSVAESVSDKLTRTGELIGSPFYMSPEQAQGAKIDARSDLYSLGCVMFESLTGSPPFTKTTVLESVMAHVSEQPLTMSQAVLGTRKFNEDLETVVARLLMKNPDLRYQSMKELKDHLTSISEGSGLRSFVYNQQKPKHSMKLMASMVSMALVATTIVAYLVIKNSAPLAKRLNFLIEHVNHSFDVGEKQARDKVEYSEMHAPDAQKWIELAVDHHTTRLDIGLEGVTTDSDLAPLQYATAPVIILLKYASVRGDGLKYLKNIHTLKQLDLSHSGVISLKHLADCPFLQKLNLDATEIGDSELEPIRNLNLTSIDLSSTGVHTLSALKNMKSLTEIALVHANIRSSAMALIGQLKNLEKVQLTETPITDADLKYLAHLPKLNEVSLLRCPNLTDAAVLKLKNGLAKDCSLLFDFGRSAANRSDQHLDPKTQTRQATDSANDVEAKMAKAMRLYGNAYYKDALPLYKAVLKSLESDPVKRWDTLMLCYVQMGHCQCGQHEFPSALQSFTRAINILQAHPAATDQTVLPQLYCHVGATYFAMNRKEDAIRMHQHADQLYASTRSIAMTTASTAMQKTESHRWDLLEASNLLDLYLVYQKPKPTLEDDRHSEPLIERIFTLWGADPIGTDRSAGVYHEQLAGMYVRDAKRAADPLMRKRDYDKAMQQLEQALKIFGALSRDASTIDAMDGVQLQIGMVAFELREYDKAEAIFKEQLKSGPKRLRKPALHGLYGICFGQHRDAEAKMYQAELAKLPRN